jgi:hypothetical protein
MNGLAVQRLGDDLVTLPGGGHVVDSWADQ